MTQDADAFDAAQVGDLEVGDEQVIGLQIEQALGAANGPTVAFTGIEPMMIEGCCCEDAKHRCPQEKADHDRDDDECIDHGALPLTVFTSTIFSISTTSHLAFLTFFLHQHEFFKLFVR